MGNTNIDSSDEKIILLTKKKKKKNWQVRECGIAKQRKYIYVMATLHNNRFAKYNPLSQFMQHRLMT